MGDGELSIDWMKVVPVWVHLLVVNGDQDIPLFHPRLCCRSVLIDLIHVHSAVCIPQLQIAAQLRITRRREAEPGSWEAPVGVMLRFDQEMPDDRAGDRINGL